MPFWGGWELAFLEPLDLYLPGLPTKRSVVEHPLGTPTYHWFGAALKDPSCATEAQGTWSAGVPVGTMVPASSFLAPPERF